MATDGKVVLVTGATGMSRAAAVALARRGWRVAVMSRTEAEVAETIRQVEEAGSEGLALQGDVSREDDVKRAYARIVAQWGGLDGVFANAGINGTWAPVEELSLADWQETVDINLTGTFLTVKYAVPHLKARRAGGAIVITSSINGTRTFSNAGASAYASTKAAQLAFAQMLAVELAPDNVRVNVICPGAIDTQIEDNMDVEGLDRIRYPRSFPQGQIPLTHGSPGKPEDVAAVVAFLLSEDAAFITGTPVWVDGAQSLFV